ncbi:MAG: ATP-binding protein [Pseudonocardiaceae bacterium]
MAVNSGIPIAMDDSGTTRPGRVATAPATRYAHNGDPSWTRQPTEDLRSPLRAEAVATARNAATLRRRLHDWLALDLPADVVADLVLAVYEAIANAAEHAYADRADGPGLMRLEAHRSADHILITVSDQGRWRPPTAGGFRGRGIPLMRLLTHNIHTCGDHHGTVVHLRVELAPTRRSARATEAS